MGKSNKNRVTHTQREEEQGKKVLRVMTVIAILLFWIIYVAFIMLRSFIRPLYEVLDNIEKINEGTYDFGAVAANGIEMQTLCQTLQTMADTQSAQDDRSLPVRSYLVYAAVLLIWAALFWQLVWKHRFRR